MKESKVSKPIAKGVATVLNGLLRTEANSASCVIIYQPKAPKDLAKYRRNK